MKKHIVSWSSFESCNPNTEKAFEFMCGTLFRQMHTPPGTILHYNPNNAGIECEPTDEIGTGKKIGFQSKYFSSRIDYSQIEHSAKKIVENYADRIDKVFLYCNKDLAISGVQYKRIKDYLKANGVDLVPVTNRAILDVVPDYPQIAPCYFNSFSLTCEWFEDKLNLSLAELGHRYNGKFNIFTETEHYLDLFYRTDDAAKAINEKKTIAVEQIRKNKWRLPEYRHAIERAIDFLQTLPNIDSHSLHSCLQWPEMLERYISGDIAIAKKCAKEVEQQYQEKHEREAREQLYSLNWFIDIPDLLQLSPIEKRILTSNVIILDGEAGMGKSHLLATMTKKVVLAGGNALLLLGQSFSSDNPVCLQIPQRLILDTDIEDLLLSKR